MIIDLIFIVAAVGVLIAIYKLKFSQQNIKQDVQAATEEERKNIEAQQRIPQEQTSQNIRPAASGWQGQEESSDSDEEGVDRKKQLKKQQKLKEKQQRKQAQEYYLEQEKQKRQKYQKETEERERLEEERKRKEDQVVAQLREEERKRKEEEFNKWKDMFKVEQTGKEKLSEDEQKKKADVFKQQLASFLRSRKLIQLEQLSHKYKLSTKEMVQKIKLLESEGLISGIFDERGKYLVIEQDEWTAIRNYITTRGRVKKTDIMTECAKLIKIPDEVEEELLNLVQDQANP